jgi:hypothetical protein
MNAKELVDRAQGFCRAMRRPFPTELKAYASGWQRQGYHLPWCWARVKGALREGRAVWQVETEVHRHHARLQSEKADRDRKAGDPLVASPTPDADRHWDSEGHRQAAVPPASAGGMRDDPDRLDDLPLCAEQAQPRATARRPLPRDNQGETAASIRMRMRWGWTDGARA